MPITRKMSVPPITQVLKYKLELLKLSPIIPRQLKHKPCKSVTMEDVISPECEGFAGKELDFGCCEESDFPIQICTGWSIIKKCHYSPHLYKITGLFSTKHSSIDNVKKRRYIVPGEECPICYEPIISKQSAYITNCGHRFHYGCIQQCEYVDLKNLGCCPFCRQNIGLEPHSLKFRNELSSKGLDRLEDFWFNFGTFNPQMCYKYDVPHDIIYDIHVLGMKSSCTECLDFRKGKTHPQFNSR